jgi:hypothetical protein
VPDDLLASVQRYAAEHRTSTNDALVRLAYAGASAYERRREIDELAAVRRDAILESLRSVPVPPDAEPLTADDVTEAILGFRLGLYDEDEFGA